MFELLKNRGTEDLLSRKWLYESVLDLINKHNLFLGVTVYMMLLS